MTDLRFALSGASLLLLLTACGGSPSSAASSGTDTTSTTTAQPDGCATAAAATTVSSSANSSSFGLSTSDTFYTVDTGAGLVFKIRRLHDASTRKAGDLASMVYQGVEYLDTTAGSQINAGLDYLYTSNPAVDVSATLVDADHIRITATAGDMTQYYLARRGDPRVYMATTFASEPNQDKEGFVRFIVRARRSVVPDGPPAARVFEGTSTIESADIFKTDAGETRAKHYANERLRDWLSVGATGSQVGLWVVRGNAEGMSGGPFYRSLLEQDTGTQQQLTYMINYGMAQTEAFRTQVLNTYALVFTDGSAPTAIDTRWFDTLGLKNWVPPAGRGAVSGAAILGQDSAYRYTVGWANGAAQYWTTPNAKGTFSCGGMLPGDYQMTVYKNELAVASQAVTVAAGGTTTVGTLNITADPSSTTPVWRIGDWDGTPLELLNGDKINRMHPSDVRIATWVPGPFVVGTSTAQAGFPAYLWKDVNSGQQVQFALTADQVRGYQLRIGLTTAYLGGRPQVKVNSWTSPAPAASSQPDTRSLTVGTYRGNNTLYTFNIPASALVVGQNTVNIQVISGSAGSSWLSPGFSVDAVDLIVP